MPKSRSSNPNSSVNDNCPSDSITHTCQYIPKGCEYLNKPYLVQAPVVSFDKVRKEGKLGPRTETKYRFPGDTHAQDAFEREIEVKGRKIKIITPKSWPPAGEHLPTDEEIAKALGTVPEEQLATIKEVDVSPNRNPKDAYWEKVYNKKGFRSAATGGNGKVTYYPTTNKLSQAVVDSNTIHEGGHTFSGELWKDEAKKKAWQDAIEKDKPNSPSQYADKAPTEDFSESLVMYSLSKGTPCEATAQKLYPNRYKALDEIFASNVKTK
jgi:hypothetical protein